MLLNKPSFFGLKKKLIFKNTLLKKWFTKKRFKIKLFERNTILNGYNLRSIQIRNTSTSLAFQWKSSNINFINVHCVNINSIMIFNNTNLPVRIIAVPFILTNIYFWLNLIYLVYTVSQIKPLTLTSITQLTKYFHTNQTTTLKTSSTLFNSQRINLINFKQPSTYSLTTVDSKVLSKKSTMNKVFSFFSKYLPHINLVRLFRRTYNKKPISYMVNKKTFFKNALIRLNLDHKYYKLNTLQNVNKSLSNINKYSLIVRGLSMDNLLETQFDSILVNNNSFKTNYFYAQSSKLNMSTNNFSSQKNFFLPNLSSLNLLMTDFLNVQLIIGNPLLYKYIFWLVSPNNHFKLNLDNSVTALNNHLFSSRINLFKLTNIWPSAYFHFSLKRKILKIFSFNKFLPNVTMWYYNVLIRFMESCTGKKVFLKFNPFIENTLSFSDIARCNMWSIRINSFQRLLGPKIFLNESLRIMHIALRFKDPTFFANWIKGMLNRMSFWKYRLLFRYIKFAMRYLFWLYFAELQFKGLKIKLKGKISVAGNARTRTLVYRIGETGYSKMDNRVVCDASTINTFTGVLGFKIWFFF